MKHPFWLLGAFALGLAACDTARQQADSNSAATAETVSSTGSAGTMEKNGIRFTPFEDSPKYPEAQMTLKAPVASSNVASGAVPFDYDLSNFILTKMSGGPHAEHMANSAQGQHIHNIVDNQPYTAHYTTEFTKPLADGQHVVLSFLSRSYHESLKHRGAYDLRVINVGKVAQPLNADLKAPHLFYSRPKDTYTGKDAQKVMLDFYLVNTTLSPDGNKVRATINGTEFMLDRWAPYMMEGLPMGENTIKLELVDANGTMIPGPFNSVTRSFTLQP